jgi:hypothetical protein
MDMCDEYIDKRGESYLSTPLHVNDKLIYCSKHHRMRLLRENPKDELKQICCKCDKNFYFIR